MADTQETKPSSSADETDPLLACLREIARRHARPASDTALLAGLPREERLSLDGFVRCAERIGLEARAAPLALRELVPVHLPALILTKAGRALIVFRADGQGRLEVFDPERGGTQWRHPADVEAEESRRAILITPAISDEAAALAPKAHWLWGVAARFWRSYVRVIVASAVINVLALASSLFILNVYDRVLPNQAFATLWVLAIGVVLAFAFDFALRQVRAVIIDHVGRRVDLKVSSALFERILNAPLLNRPQTTGAFANKASEYEFVRDFFTSSTVTLAVDMAFAFVFLAVIYMLAGWIVAIPAAAIAIVLLIGLVVQARIGRRMAQAQEQAALRHSLLVEAVASIETVKSLRGEGHLLGRWDQLVRASSETQEKIKRLSAFAASATAFVQQMVGVSIVIAGVHRFGEGDMSMGAIIATVILAGRATAPLGQLASMLARARHAAQALKTLDEIMALPDERDAAAHRVNRTVAHGEIEFRDVEFSYPGAARKTLAGISFRIRPGEKVGVIGRIGSGKTTIGRLMAGLYQPGAGEVLIDGVDIRQYHPHEVRSAISLVVQDADLFHGSVKSNLLVANPKAEDADLVRAAQLSGLDQIVTSHPLGFEMPVGEKGASLSGGQRQILSITRALASPFKVLFLDEPTSAMDTMTERQLIARLKLAIDPACTFVLCTHRHSALALVDRLLVIDGGKVVADGPKDEVLKALQEAARPRTVTGRIDLAARNAERGA